MDVLDIIVIGGGPAGISSAIYAHRAGMKVLVIDGGDSTLKKAKKIDNYYGIVGLSGEELVKTGIEQYKNLGGKYIQDNVVGIKQNFIEKTFSVQTKNKEFLSKTVILCLGASKKKSLPILEKYEGTNVSYCAVCDGFFYKNMTVAVIGDGDFAVNECKELSHIAKKIYLISNKKIDVKGLTNVESITKEVVKVDGNNKVESITFVDGDTISVDGVFVAVGTMSSFDIAKRLGVLMNKDFIVVDKNYMTNIAGVFAGGDVIGGLLQVSKAVSDGANAGLEATRFIKVMEYNEKD